MLYFWWDQKITQAFWKCEEEGEEEEVGVEVIFWIIFIEERIDRHGHHHNNII